MDNMYKEYLQRLPFWDKLTVDDKKLLLANVYSNHYQAGQTVSSAGVDCLGVVIVQKGCLRVYLLSEEGKEVTIYKIREGELCVLSASCVISAITFEVQIDAEMDSDVLIIPTPIFAFLMEKNIYVENFSYQLTAERLSNVILAVERLFFMTLEQRLIVFLLDETTQQGNNELRITQDKIARSIGSAREAVSRILKTLSEDNLVELFRGGVYILDKKSLYQRIDQRK